MDKGITNIQMNKIFENEENQGIKNNYMGVYSMDSITKYINFYEIIIKKKKLNIHFLYLIQTNIINQVCSGGVLWIFIQKKRIFLFDALGLEGFKFFIVNNDERVINELLFDYKKCNTNLNNHKLKLCAMKFCIQA